ncbi:MAG: sugar phosphate isomerase/epimerase [Planctomycetes bacterium]|nr:sugar phosphate isomerase/epimerase [Planctomycetota bacterium]
MFRNLSLDALGISGRQSELIEWTLSYGFKGLDLDLTEFGRQVETQGIEKAKRLIVSARLKLGSFQLPVDWQSDEETFRRDLDKLTPLAEMAAALGCHRARTTVEPAGYIRPYHENFELCRRRCREIGEVLAPTGVRLGLGFRALAKDRLDRAFQFIHTFDALTMLVKMIGSENVGLVLDVWQWHVSGATQEQIQTVPAKDVVAVYLSDATTVAGRDDVEESTRVLPGENGTIDAAAILASLAAGGYDGPITPNPHPHRFADLAREQIIKQTSQALDKVWQAAGLSKSGKLGVTT